MALSPSRTRAQVACVDMRPTARKTDRLGGTTKPSWRAVHALGARSRGGCAWPHHDGAGRAGAKTPSLNAHAVSVRHDASPACFVLRAA